MECGFVFFKGLRAFNIFPMAERQTTYKAKFSSQKTCVYRNAATHKPAHICMYLYIHTHTHSWKHLLEASKTDLIMENSQHLLKLLNVCNFRCLQEGNKDIQQLHVGCSPLPLLHKALRNVPIYRSHSSCSKW